MCTLLATRSTTTAPKHPSSRRTASTPPLAPRGRNDRRRPLPRRRNHIAKRQHRQSIIDALSDQRPVRQLLRIPVKPPPANLRQHPLPKCNRTPQRRHHPPRNLPRPRNVLNAILPPCRGIKQKAVHKMPAEKVDARRLACVTSAAGSALQTRCLQPPQPPGAPLILTNHPPQTNARHPPAPSVLLSSLPPRP